MPGELTTIIAALSCGAFVAITEPVTIVLLRRAAALDVPGQRSSHTVATPRGGGAPIVVGLVAVGLSARDLATPAARGPQIAAAFAFAVAAFAAIGLADDLADLSAIRRLALQSVASVAIAVALVRSLGSPLVETVVAGVVVALWVMAFVNAFNFMDGVNGIAAAHAVVGGAAYACIGVWRSLPFLVVAGAAIAAGALAFMPWNAGRARVFLGDVGSYGIGAAFALLAAWAVVRRIPVEAAVGPLALYLADTAWTLQRRIRSGERWLEAHRTHVYQQLCDVGWSHQRVAAMTATGTVVLSLLGMASLTSSVAIRAMADCAGVALLAVYLRSPAIVVRAVKVLEGT